jgi:hypothetical protein
MKLLHRKWPGCLGIFYLAGCFVLCMAWPTSVASQEVSSPSQDKGSCRLFVQAFYDWYVPFTQKSTKDSGWGVAVRYKAKVFNTGLLHALKVDSEASAQAKGEIVGLDFDPFVGSQDPAEHYEVRHASLKSNKCFVEVWRASPTDTAAKSGKPDVIAEVAFRGQWKFLNFQYPQTSGDLLGVLKALAQERRKH